MSLQATPGPPDPEWDSTEFASAVALALNGYDNTNQALKNAGGTPYFLVVSKSAAAGTIKWMPRAASAANGCLCALVSLAAFNAINGGTVNTATGVITNGGKTYLLKLKDDGNGQPIADV